MVKTVDASERKLEDLNTFKFSVMFDLIDKVSASLSARFVCSTQSGTAINPIAIAREMRETINHDRCQI